MSATPFEIISWMVVIAFSIVLILTLAGMVGLVKFRHENHLNKLFGLLILEIVSLGFLIYKEGTQSHAVYLRQSQNYLDEARELATNEDYDSALNKLSEILGLDVESEQFHIKDVFLERGNILFKRNLFKDAVTPYAVYNEIVKDDAQALSNYGRVLREVHRYEEAKTVYEQALKLEPNDYYIINGLQNCIRRLAGFMLEADRRDSADEYFQIARTYIQSMRTIANTATEKREKKILKADLALARLNYQWERYPETIALLEDIIDRFPEHSIAYEDLAAVLIEYGELQADNLVADEMFSKALDIYSKAYEISLEDQDKVFIGSGIAEATALKASPTNDEIKDAMQKAALSIALNKDKLDDPYPFYASAILYKKQGKDLDAYNYINDAIRAEKKRANNPYTFDYKRLNQYQQRKQAWGNKP